MPLLIAVLPFAGVSLAYWIASSRGLIPSCIPYLEGCTSISATGRYPPASYVFKAVELPLAVMLIVTWQLSVQWVRSVDESALCRTRSRFILFCGAIGAIALIVYVTLLGTQAPLYEFMRRFGIYIYFTGTALAQAWLAFAVLRIRTTDLQVYTYVLLVTSLVPIALGFLSLGLSVLLDETDALENRIEWIGALMMQIYFLVLWLAWRRTGFDVVVSLGSQRR